MSAFLTEVHHLKDLSQIKISDEQKKSSYIELRRQEEKKKKEEIERLIDKNK